MASQAAKFVILILVFICISMLFYISEYANMSKTLQPATTHLTTNQFNPQRYQNNKQTFYVETYNLINDRLELTGFYRSYKGLDTNSSDIERLVLNIEGLSDLINKLKPQILTDHKLGKAELSADKYFLSNRRAQLCDCSAMFKNDQAEIARAKTLTRKYISSPQDYMALTKNCFNFIKGRGYITDPLTQVEEEFPIAFSIIMYTAIEQSERLLRAIYRPQNFYCIHVDGKTDQSIYDAMTSIANCFDNVFIASKRFDVQWGTMTVLEPDLHCMSELYNRSKSWKYFINLTGQEFPLRTNYELVQILKAYNGANDIDGTRKRANTNRWTNAGELPHNITPTKGSLHIVASRGYVNFVLHDQRAKDFLEWCRKVEIPDEVFFTSLQHNPHLGVPGSYKGIPETFSSDTTNEKPFVTRFKNWGDGVYNWPCHGKRVRLICVIGVADLSLLATRKELFVNKLQYHFEPMAFDCLEELLFNHTRDIYLGKLAFDAQWYRNLGFVKNKVTK